ncbi:GNAT family N-acetyltransferase [Halocatena marina]|uniref:GNAT family N-acetyltransferase n=1 Tax=Halocatena marina TaxID=2934937 RepID=A0ABD5YPX5_9EURY|nr:GNAT family N-acetyltransferase [Halocatena marina]
MSPVQIRSATPADAPAIERTARRSWHATYDALLGERAVNEVVDAWYDLSDLRSATKRDEHVFIVASKEDSTVGFAHAAFDAAHNGWVLFRIYVAPDHWDNGIGTALLGRIETELKDRGVSTYELVVFAENDVGVNFYESHDFDRFETVETKFEGVETAEHKYRKQL